jgi:hypothetical protein
MEICNKNKEEIYVNYYIDKHSEAIERNNRKYNIHTPNCEGCSLCHPIAGTICKKYSDYNNRYVFIDGELIRFSTLL